MKKGGGWLKLLWGTIKSQQGRIAVLEHNKVPLTPSEVEGIIGIFFWLVKPKQVVASKSEKMLLIT